MNDEGVLAFHIVSEIAENEIYDVPSLMDWYNRSLAAFQNDYLDRVKAEELLEKLEKIKILEKKGNHYKITNLGRVAAYLYFSPYSIAGWYFNFNKIIRDDIIDDITTSCALSNIKEIKDQVDEYKRRCVRYGLSSMDSQAFMGTLYYSCLVSDNGVNDIHKRQAKFDIQRIISALMMIDKMYGNWKQQDFFKKLELRIQYEISEEQTELCSLKGVGGVFVKKLFKAGITTIDEFVYNPKIAKSAIGATKYNSVIEKNGY